MSVFRSHLLWVQLFFPSPFYRLWLQVISGLLHNYFRWAWRFWRTDPGPLVNGHLPVMFVVRVYHVRDVRSAHYVSRFCFFNDPVAAGIWASAIWCRATFWRCDNWNIFVWRACNFARRSVRWHVCGRGKFSPADNAYKDVLFLCEISLVCLFYANPNKISAAIFCSVLVKKMWLKSKNKWGQWIMHFFDRYINNALKKDITEQMYTTQLIRPINCPQEQLTESTARSG